MGTIALLVITCNVLFASKTYSLELVTKVIQRKRDTCVSWQSSSRRGLYSFNIWMIFMSVWREKLEVKDCIIDRGAWRLFICPKHKRYCEIMHDRLRNWRCISISRCTDLWLRTWFKILFCEKHNNRLDRKREDGINISAWAPAEEDPWRVGSWIDWQYCRRPSGCTTQIHEMTMNKTHTLKLDDILSICNIHLILSIPYIYFILIFYLLFVLRASLLQ